MNKKSQSKTNIIALFMSFLLVLVLFFNSADAPPEEPQTHTIEIPVSLNPNSVSVRITGTEEPFKLTKINHTYNKTFFDAWFNVSISQKEFNNITNESVDICSKPSQGYLWVNNSENADWINSIEYFEFAGEDRTAEFTKETSKKWKYKPSSVKNCNQWALMRIVLDLNNSETDTLFLKWGTGSTTIEVTTNTGDGEIYRSGDGSWAEARDGTTGTLQAESWMRAGVSHSYYIMRGYLFFDTSAIPAGATINSAKLSLNPYQPSTNQIHILVLTGNATHPHSPLIAEDFNRLIWNGNKVYGRESTEGHSANTYFNITLNDTSIINDAGNTTMILIGDGDYNNTNVGIDRYEGYNTGSIAGKEPYITITYTEGAANTAPEIISISPANGTLINDNTPRISFKVNDSEQATTSCTIYVNGSNKGNNASVVNNTVTYLDLTALTTNGNQLWYVSCTDGSDTTKSMNRIFNLDTLIRGYVKVDGILVSDAMIEVIKQPQNVTINNTRSNANGYYIASTSGPGNYTLCAYDPNNYTRGGDCKPFIELEEYL